MRGSSSKQHVGYPYMLGTCIGMDTGHRIRHVAAMNTLDAYVSAMRCDAMLFYAILLCLSFPGFLFFPPPLVLSSSPLSFHRGPAVKNRPRLGGKRRRQASQGNLHGDFLT
jgi:hypothetical protein